MTTKLTAEQRKFLLMVAHGFSNLEIAAVLHVTEQTAGRRMSEIRDDLRARNRAHAVWLGLTEGHLEVAVEQPPALEVPGVDVDFQPQVIAWEQP